MKLAHLSDLHLGVDGDDHARTAWLLEDALNRGAEHVVLAGDLLDHGNFEDLTALRSTLRRLHLWDPSRLTIVPGNHDIIGARLHEVSAALEELREASGRSAVDLALAAGRLVVAGAKELPTVVGDSARKRKARHRAFLQASRTLRAGTQRGRHRTFAHRKCLDGFDLVSVDTTNPEFFMRGEVGKAQLQDLAELVGKSVRGGRLPIVVAHHRPIDVHASDVPEEYQLMYEYLDEDMNLLDAEDVLGTVAEAGGDLVLCGHWHVLGEYYERSSGVLVRTQGRSGAMDADAESGTVYSYDLLDVRRGRVRSRTIEHAIEDIDVELGIEVE